MSKKSQRETISADKFPWDTVFGAHEFDDDMDILDYFREDQEEFKKMCKEWENVIDFRDFFPVADPEKTKVKFNMNSGITEIRAWDNLNNETGSEDDEWYKMNAYRQKKSSNDLDLAEYLLAFAQYYPYGPDYYIFGGMYTVEKIVPEKDKDIGYKLTLLDDFKAYRKRLIIRLNKPIGRDLYTRWYKNVADSLNPEVYELAPSVKLGSFPGFNNVRLTHAELQTIIKGDEPQWKNALSSVKGVYCITDTKTGQLYIGAAYGVNGVWGRWSNYADVDNLTGGNKAFEELKVSGANYIIDNFTYTILEIFDPRTKDEDIIHRESYWKTVFQSIRFGMNRN